MPSSFALLFTFSLSIVVSAAFAAPSVPEEEARFRLINEAKAAHTAKDHKKALELAERAASIQLTPSLRYFLAYEQEEIGLLAEAFGNAQQCARDFELDASLPQRTALLRACRTLRDNLGARIGYLIIVPPTVPADIAVKVGGRAVNRALFGVPYLVTPGVVSVEATAPGHQPFRSEMTVSPGPPAEVKIALAKVAPPTIPSVPEKEARWKLNDEATAPQAAKDHKAAPPTVRAVPEKEARWRLINDATAAHIAKDHKKALELLERAASIQLTPSLRYFLASEQKEIGLLAEAFGNAQQCTRDVELDTTLPGRTALLAFCRTLRDNLAAGMGYLLIVPPAAPANIAVKVGGREVNRALFGRPYLVTPGAVSVEATAPGYYPFRSELTVRLGPAVQVVKIALTRVAAPAVDGEKRTPAADRM